MQTPPHPFRIHNFRAYWVARLSMTLAQYAMLLIIGWQTYNLARDGGASVQAASAQLALIGLLQFLPLFVLTPFSGLVADRLNRRNVGRLTVLLQLLCAALLAWLTSQDAVTPLALFGVAVMLGIARAFAGPALSALAPNLVPREVLPTAIALSSISWQVGMIAGPGLGGYLYAVQPALPYIVSAALFAVSVLALGLIGSVPRTPIPGAQRPLEQVAEGLRYVVRNKMVLSTITLDLAAVFLAGATALFPIYARDILKVGPEGLSLLAMSPAIGAAVTAVFFSFFPLKKNVGPRMLFAVAIFGAATIVFGLSRSLPLSMAMLFIVGASDMFSVYIRQSLIQLHTPDDKRGRVSAVSMLTIGASNEGGDAFSGFLAAAIGPVAAVVAGGAGAVASVLLWSRMFPILWRTRSFEAPIDEQHPEKHAIKQEKPS